MEGLFFMIICINGMLLLLTLGAAVDLILEKIEQKINKVKRYKRNKYNVYGRHK